MESATLNKAHEHVRNAATATYGNSIAAAGAEHELAASAFHDAAQDTHNDEALRILALLQDHHHKLARLIKEPSRRKEKKSGTPDETIESSTISSSPGRASARTLSPSPSTSSPTRAPSRRRLPQSSIASNLAEKRGIPGSRRGTSTVAPASATNALGTRSDAPSTPVRDLLQRQSRNADAISPRNDKADVTPPRPSVSPPSDDNFRRFYSAFGGVISAISAPLAFTSLPLTLPAPTPVEPSPPPADKKKSLDASQTIKSSEPDISALISKPALRALREDSTTPLGPFANNESFYFVPTSGGTVSYANIVRDPAAHPHHAAQNPHLDSIDEGEDERGGLRGSSHEEFVDARESINPPSPTAPRRPRSRGSTTSGITNARSIPAGRGTGQKTMEELALENETMRSLIDKQAKRLSMWETTSQSSYNALAQSFRARSGGGKQLSDPSALAQALSMGSSVVPPALPSPPIQSQSQTQPSSPASTPDAERKRIAELESLLASQSSHLAALEAEKEQLRHTNEKHALVIGRYREQWEKLKAGARKKEQERRERRVEELKKGEPLKDSESGEATGEGEEVMDEEPGFGKA